VDRHSRRVASHDGATGSFRSAVLLLDFEARRRRRSEIIDEIDVLLNKKVHELHGGIEEISGTRDRVCRFCTEKLVSPDSVDGQLSPKKAVVPPLEVLAPRWSREAKRIVFMGRKPGEGWRLYLVASEGGNSPQELLAGDDGQAAPDWSPDGNTVVFGGSQRKSQGMPAPPASIYWICGLIKRRC
jgi:hypothetical protein